MPVGDTHQAFNKAAQNDGIDLVDQSVDWLNQRGHLGLPDDEHRRLTIDALERIYVALGGDLQCLRPLARRDFAATSSTRGAAR